MATALVLGLALVLPSEAAAQGGCGCRCEGGGLLVPQTVQPVAANARVFLRLADYPGSTLALTSRGVALDFTLEPAGDELGLAAWMVPSDPLTDGVRILADDGFRVSEFGYDFVAEVDTTPPAIGEVRLEGLRDGDYCSGIVGARVVVGFPSGADTEGVTFEVELFRDGVSLGRTFPWTAFGTVADPDCLGPGYISGLVAGETLDAVVRVWDMAGNYVERGPFTFTVDHAEPGSSTPCAICSARPAGTRPMGVWLSAAALVGALLLRRRGSVA